MEYARAPLNCLRPAEEYNLDIDTANAARSLPCKTRKATPDDIAVMTPKPTIIYSICAEMGLKRNPEKKPEYPFELGLNREERSLNNG